MTPEQGRRLENLAYEYGKMLQYSSTEEAGKTFQKIVKEIESMEWKAYSLGFRDGKLPGPDEGTPAAVPVHDDKSRLLSQQPVAVADIECRKHGLGPHGHIMGAESVVCTP